MYTYMYSEIKRKRSIVKTFAPSEDVKSELLYQVEICEELGRPLSDGQVMALCKMPLNQIRTTLFSHKVA